MRSVSAPIEPAADIHVNLASFTRSLRATNLSPRTIQSYAESTRLLAGFLIDHGMPTTVVAIRREHLEAFIASLLARWKPATAHNRYRGCQAFFRWLLEEGEITVSPFAKMKPPLIPEAAAPVLSDAQIKALVGALGGRTFEDKRDAAITRIFLDTGLRLAELANLRYDARAELRTDVELDFHRLRVIGKGRRVSGSGSP
jgi:site-specific recombinase XerC